MKCKFTIQQRKNLKSLIENPNLSGGVSLGDIRLMLSIVDKLEYKGSEEDISTDTELTFEGEEIQKLHQIAHNFSGWPVAAWVGDLHDRLESYKKKSEK